MSGVRAREAVKPPNLTSPVTTGRRILILHPGYGDDTNVLLRLFAPEILPGEARSGLAAQYALDACGIITGNRWDGWLSESKASVATRIDPASILLNDSYYFHLPAQNTNGTSQADPYPVVPTFRQWRFPHNRLPLLWQQTASNNTNSTTVARPFAPSSLTLALHYRDISCRITGCTISTQVAHLCPQAESDWWYKNVMSNYNVGISNTLSDPSNALLLRADLHIAFDTPLFVFVPRLSSDSISNTLQLVTHCFQPAAELEDLYHNRTLQSSHPSIEMVFARFAWSIFPLLEPFLACRKPRRLLVVEEDAAMLDEKGYVSAEKCAMFTPKTPQSSKRRKPGSEAMMGDEAGQAVNELDSTISLTSPPTDSPTETSKLAQEWLRRERLRSDPAGNWEEEKSWAADVWQGKIPLDAESARRWYQIIGFEVTGS